jgi:hypothetical protein
MRSGDRNNLSIWQYEERAVSGLRNKAVSDLRRKAVSGICRRRLPAYGEMRFPRPSEGGFRLMEEGGFRLMDNTRLSDNAAYKSFISPAPPPLQGRQFRARNAVELQSPSCKVFFLSVFGPPPMKHLDRT